jgi:hypothetical protein
MTSQLSQIKWVRVVLTAIVFYILSFITIFIVITAYATYLGFQARGAPDQNLITAFADQYAPWIGPIALILFTFLASMMMARRLNMAVQPNGIALGAFASILNLIFEGPRAFDAGFLITVLLTIAAGWLGARSTNK